MAGNIVFSRAQTNINVSGGNYANNPRLAAGSPAFSTAAFFTPAATLPAVTTNTLDLQLTAQYVIDKASSIRAMYSFMHMNSRDYAYQGMQPSGLTVVLPTYESAPTYNVHAISLPYNYSFQ